MDERALLLWVQTGAEAGAGGVIAWFLWKEGKRHKERVRKNDIAEAANREQGRTQAEALGKIGQAIDRELARLRAKPPDVCPTSG